MAASDRLAAMAAIVRTLGRTEGLKALDLTVDDTAISQALDTAGDTVRDNPHGMGPSDRTLFGQLRTLTVRGKHWFRGARGLGCHGLRLTRVDIVDAEFGMLKWLMRSGVVKDSCSPV